MGKWRTVSARSLLKLNVKETIMERQSEKEFQGQNIHFPESQTKKTSFLFIFNKEPLKEFEQKNIFRIMP